MNACTITPLEKDIKDPCVFILKHDNTDLKDHDFYFRIERTDKYIYCIKFAIPTDKGFKILLNKQTLFTYSIENKIYNSNIGFNYIINALVNHSKELHHESIYRNKY